MHDLYALKKWLVTASIGASAVRNQGNGIVQPIRNFLIKKISIDMLIQQLKAPDDAAFKRYLDSLTAQLATVKGKSNNHHHAGKVAWGTARKCINLAIRAIIYNGFIWEAYNISRSDFAPDGIMFRLELPLDSYAAKNIKDDCEKLGIPFEQPQTLFSIIGLTKSDNSYYQQKAAVIAAARATCRVRLDEGYWRRLGTTV